MIVYFMHENVCSRNTDSEIDGLHSTISGRSALGHQQYAYHDHRPLLYGHPEMLGTSLPSHKGCRCVLFGLPGFVFSINALLATICQDIIDRVPEY